LLNIFIVILLLNVYIKRIMPVTNRNTDKRIPDKKNIYVGA